MCLKLCKGAYCKDVLRCMKRLFSYSAGKGTEAGSSKMSSWGRLQDRTHPLPPALLLA